MSLSAISRTDRNASTQLRHGRAHRAKLEAIAAKRDTVVFAERCASFMDGIDGMREAMEEIKAWARAGGRSGSLIYSESQRDTNDSMLRVKQVISVKGHVTLPTVVGHWKVAKATPEQEAWAKRMANR